MDAYLNKPASSNGGELKCDSKQLSRVSYPWKGDILEDFLFCWEVPGRTTGERVVKLLDAWKSFKLYAEIW